MGVEQSDRTDFGRVSRFKGRLFEALSLGASVFGILMLAVLLVYVIIDSFGLETASPEWLLTYYVTLVLPFLGFCLYSANDRALARRTVLVLGVGLVAAFAVFTGIEQFVRPIPRLSWPLFYLFLVVVPVTAYVGFVGSRAPAGFVGFGLVGRLVGGAGFGVALFMLFGVFEPATWFWAYTFGVLPAVGLHAYSRRSLQSPLTLAVLPVVLTGATIAVWRTSPTAFALYLLSLTPAGIVLVRAGRRTEHGRILGAGLATLLVGVGGAAGSLALGIDLVSVVPRRPVLWGIYVWTLAVPLSVTVGVLTARRTTRRQGLVTGGLVLGLAAGGSQAAAAVDITPATALLYLLAIGVPTVMYVHRTVDGGTGVPGLVLPVVLAGGAVLGAAVTSAWGVGTPDPWLDPSFLSGTAHPLPEQAGFYPAIVGSVLIISMVAILSFTLGVGTAVFLEEYTPKSGPLATVTRIVQINIANLAAVPSVVYGLLGLGIFINIVGFGLGTATTAAITLSLLILPITVISAQEAIRSVPDSMRNASYAMGATRWQTTKNVVLPEAFSGILTGTILALGRAIGETAPLIMIGAPTVVFSAPNSISDKVAAMPMQIFAWSSSAQTEFQYGVLAAGVVTLLAVLIGLNATAIILRNRSEQR